MKLAASADVHLGNHGGLGGSAAETGGLNDRFRAALAVLARARRNVLANGADAWVICGDVCDVDTPTPVMLAAIGEVLREAGPVILVVGNHDQTSAHHSHHALSVFRMLPNVIVVEHPAVIPVGDGELWAVPYRAGDASVWLPDALDLLEATCDPARRGRRACAVHLGIRDPSDTTPWAVAAHDAVSSRELFDQMLRHDMRAAFAGNWHDRRHWEEQSHHPATLPVFRHIIQCGALVPTGHDNPGLDGYGTVAWADLADDGTVAWAAVSFQEIPGPRFVTIADQAELDAVLRQNVARAAGPCDLHVRAVVQPEHAQLARTWLPTPGLSKTTGVVSFRVDVDREAAQAAARHAAVVARSSSTLLEALTTYVRTVEAPPGVDRARVFDRCRGYLDKSGAGR